MVVIEFVNEAGSSSNGSKQLAKHGAEIVGDIPNYTKIEPKVAHFAAFLGQRKQLLRGVVRRILGRFPSAGTLRGEAAALEVIVAGDPRPRPHPTAVSF
jgi:hypothetical protein